MQASVQTGFITFWAKRGIDRTLRLSDPIRWCTTSKRIQYALGRTPLEIGRRSRSAVGDTCPAIWGKSPWRISGVVRKRHIRRQRTMRKSKVETAKTRERIIKAAGAKFAANGISEAALARVMAAAGLTRGGFYRHFASKDPLVLEACSETVFSLIARPGIAHQRKASRAGAWAHCASICVARPSQPAENRLSPGRSGERTGAERHQDSSRGHRRISPPV